MGEERCEIKEEKSLREMVTVTLGSLVKFHIELEIQWVPFRCIIVFYLPWHVN